MFSEFPHPAILEALRDISAKAFDDETECLKTLLHHTKTISDKHQGIAKSASKLIREVRENKTISGIESFLNEYGLNSREGVTIMCLAEALLRIPDSATADSLIHDRFTGMDWEKHLGHSPSLFVNASTWGLLLTGTVIRLEDTENSLGKLLGGIVSKAGEPVIRAALKKAMRILGTEFVLGETIEDAIKNAGNYTRKSYLLSYDVLGEGARSEAQAAHYYQGYLNAIARIGSTIDTSTPLMMRPGISVKLSALHPRYELLKYSRLKHELLPRLTAILQHAMQQGIAVTFDAEEASRLDCSLMLFYELISKPEFENFNGIGLAVQAYQKRALPVLQWLQHMAKETGRRIPVRLVKGAYWDSEIKKAQALGLLNYPVFTRKCHTDSSYLACASYMLAHPKQFYPQFATHNALTISTILEIAEGKEYEFQRLHGMGEALYDRVIANYKIKCRIYAPVGAHIDLLSYLIRRLLENGANTSFVHQFADINVPLEKLTADPLTESALANFQPSPDIPLPEDIYSDRKNPSGLDLGNLNSILGMDHTSLVIDKPGDSSADDCKDALAKTSSAYPSWSFLSVDERAAILDNIADLYEENRDGLIGYCMQEGHKTLADSIGELREAIDYCRYYAANARTQLAPKTLPAITGETNSLTLQGRGVFCCISPWNFPLAIFTGQIVAALVAGNCVIAKPAEQTSAIAIAAIRLMHEAGIPQDVLIPLVGDGAVIGKQILSDRRISGVVFTGSTDTARLINQQLAEREGEIIPLIAETGGQNCMIVDSTALLEHAVDDIMASAFGSAGQRCSALRVLYVQRDIADNLITLLSNAMAEITCGDPLDMASDIGPVIDDDAYKMLARHAEKMRAQAKTIYAPPGVKKTRLFPPQCFEMTSIDILSKENFGPILHVIRYGSDELDHVIDEINSSGYGLTFGVHSRIEEKVAYLRARIHAGNFYVNRNMIGAVVGMQPFGGEGLSGTGPKAGGPHYLLRFCKERTFTVNTAAIGGNLELYTR